VESAPAVAASGPLAETGCCGNAHARVDGMAGPRDRSLITPGWPTRRPVAQLAKLASLASRTTRPAFVFARVCPAAGLVWPLVVRKQKPAVVGKSVADDSFFVSPEVALISPSRWSSALMHSQYGRMRLVLVRRIFRGLDNARLLRAERGQSRIRPWRTSHA
jgi:hypothetical protein